MRPGSVTPFAAINDSEGRVTVVLERAMLEHDPLNYHPLENDRTTAIAPAGLIRFLEACGHQPRDRRHPVVAGSRASPAAVLVIAAACGHVCQRHNVRATMSDESLIGGGMAAATALLCVKDVTTATFMAEVVDASFDAAGHRRFLGAVVRAVQDAGPDARKGGARRPAARCAWSRSTSTTTPRSRSRCASSRSRRSMPSRTAGRSTASSARCRKARSSTSSTSCSAGRRRPVAGRRGDGDGQGGAAERRLRQRRRHLPQVLQREAGQRRRARRPRPGADRRGEHEPARASC